MIIWITGQHNAGKTTLAKALQLEIKLHGYSVLHIDGDQWRDVWNDHDYSEEGRLRNVRRAMAVAELFEDESTIVICSFISPNRAQREWLKSMGRTLEVYVYTTRRTTTPVKLAREYQSPQQNYITCCTDATVRECVGQVMRGFAEMIQLLGEGVTPISKYL
jgi:adenylate kinase family enzyme